MDKPITTTAPVAQTAPSPQAKKRYEPPAIICRAPLEATAGTCSVFPGKEAFHCSIANS
jgi:hypothetical protein